MPMRDGASFCRPRLYDGDDEERRDDVSMLMDALDGVVEEAMEDGDDETVYHARDLQERIADSAGDGYEAPDAGPEPAGAES